MLREHVIDALERCRPDTWTDRRTPYPGDWVRHISDPNTLGIVVAKMSHYALVVWSVPPTDPGYIWTPYVPLQVSPSIIR